MSKIIVVSEFVSAKDNSTGYFWSSLIGKAANEFSGTTVISPGSLDHVENINFVKINSIKYNKNSFFSRLFFQIFQSLQFSLKILRLARKKDTLVVGTNPSILMFFLPVLKKILGFNWVLLVHDVIPENLVPAGVLKKESLPFKLLSKYFSFVYSSPDKLIVIGRDMKDLVIEKSHIDASKVEVIQNWVDHDDIETVSKENNSVYQQLKISESDFVFTFFGNLGRVQGIANILEASKYITNDKIKILFIGDGYYKEKLVEFIKNSPEKNVLYYGAIAQEQKNEGLSACDVALVTLADGMLGLGVPSKAYFSMAANKPILSVMDTHAEVSIMVAEHDIGWVCQPSKPEELAKLFDKIYLEWAESHVSSPRKVLIDLYSEEIALNKFIKCIKTVHGNG
ncbi:MAG: glycosyltransferase family 4 protein [Gammaproteobacteria bacterium]|nr:glycosyltransferase family 4 protein [Gammaproteobacteria bacterium]